MSSLPITAFPMVGKLGKASSFSLAVVLGLAFFLAARNKQQSNPAGSLK